MRKVIELVDIKNNKDRPRLYTSKELEILRKKLAVSTAVTATTVIITACYTIGSMYNNIKLLSLYDAKVSQEEATTRELLNVKAELDSIKEEYKQLKFKYDTVKDSMDTTSEIISSLYMELDTANEYIRSSITAPSSKQYNPDVDLGNTDIITAERMNRIIEFWIDRNQAYDSPFINQGHTFIKASQLSGLDPIFIFAIASHESDFGRTRIARDKNNYMGIGAYDATPYTSAFSMGDSFEAGLISNACWVAGEYYAHGQTTLNKMIYGGKCYSTSKDKWISGINSIMSKSGTIN